MSERPAYFTDEGHLLFTGVTGAQGDYLGESGQFGGKSSLAAWWIDNPGRTRDLTIFMNTKNDDLCAVVPDFVEVATVGELAEAMGRGERRLCLTPSDPDWEAVSRRLEAFVRELPKDITKLVVLDEAPELDLEAVLSFVRVHGNGARCKSIVLSQSPTDVNTAIVKQCVPVWVGPGKSDYKAWFRTHDRLEAYKYINENHEPYHWTVIVGTGPGEWHHYDPVPAEYGGI